MAQLINSEEEGVPPSKNAGWVALGLWDRLQCCHGVPATCCLRRLQGRKRDQRSDGLGSLAERNWHWSRFVVEEDEGGWEDSDEPRGWGAGQA